MQTINSKQNKLFYSHLDSQNTEVLVPMSDSRPNTANFCWNELKPQSHIQSRTRTSNLRQNQVPRAQSHLKKQQQIQDTRNHLNSQPMAIELCNDPSTCEDILVRKLKEQLAFKIKDSESRMSGSPVRQYNSCPRKPTNHKQPKGKETPNEAWQEVFYLSRNLE